MREINRRELKDKNFNQNFEKKKHFLQIWSVQKLWENFFRAENGLSRKSANLNLYRQ